MAQIESEVVFTVSEVPELRLRLRHEPALATAGDLDSDHLTGHLIWDSGYTLACHLLILAHHAIEFAEDQSSSCVDGGNTDLHYGSVQTCRLNRLEFQGKRVLELGAGVGMVGLVCATQGAQVMLTDVQDMMETLRQNAALCMQAYGSGSWLRQSLHQQLGGYSQQQDPQQSNKNTSHAVRYCIGVSSLQWGIDGPAEMDELLRLRWSSTPPLFSPLPFSPFPPFPVVQAEGIRQPQTTQTDVYALANQCREMSLHEETHCTTTNINNSFHDSSCDSRNTITSGAEPLPFDYIVMSDVLYDHFASDLDAGRWGLPDGTRHFGFLVDVICYLAGACTQVIVALQPRHHPSEDTFFALLKRRHFQVRCIPLTPTLRRMAPNALTQLFHIYPSHLTAEAACQSVAVTCKLQEQRIRQDEQMAEKMAARQRKKAMMQI